MNLYPGFGKAHSQTFLLFVRAKTDQCFFIIRWGLSRKNPLYAVFTQNEINKYKISIKNAFCVGNTERVKEAKADYKKFTENPNVIKHDKQLKYLKSLWRTQKLEEDLQEEFK